MNTLTRSDAVALIVAASDDVASLYALARHWIGNDDLIREDAPTAREAAEWLREYVDCACDCLDVRWNGPRDSDDSNLTAPLAGGRS